MKEDQPKKMDPFFLSLSVGAGAGMGLGIVFGSPVIGLLIGTAVGVAIGMALGARAKGGRGA
jgi:hypothetical protein